MKPAATLQLKPELEAAVSSGHPWIYRDALPKHRAATGDLVRVQAGRASAYGIYDAEGAIAVRLLSREGLPDREWVDGRVAEALTLRDLVSSDGTDCYRVLNGEGDGFPGVVVDRYGRYLVVKVYSEGMRRLLPDIVSSLTRRLRPRGVCERDDTGLTPLYGETPPPELTVTENGLKLLANLYQGQKTGFFLDQRDNRAAVRKVAQGKRVLNLFAYNGGFSVYALAGGADRVVSVDVAAAALTDAERTVAINGFDPKLHETVRADVFDYLASDSNDGFDLVICDPPSLAHGRRGRHAAERAYRRLNRLAMTRVVAGGLLATASCTAQVSPEAFKAAIKEAASEAGVRAQIVSEAGQPADHPVPLHFPEGRYLKFLLLRILPPA